MTFFEFICCIVLVGISSFFSAAEVALFSLSRFQLRQLKENFRNAHRRIKTLLEDPAGVLITIIITNEVVNVSLTAIIATAVLRNWNPEWLGSFGREIPSWIGETIVTTAVATPIMLFLCEVFPKVVGTRLNRIVSPISSGPILGTYRLYFPFRLLIQTLLKTVDRLIGAKKEDEGEEEPKTEARLKEEEFLHLLEEGRKEGMIHEDELGLIRNVFELDDTMVREITTSLPDVYALPLNCKIEDALKLVIRRRYYRVPVYGKNKRDIRGVLYIKDLIGARLRPDSKPSESNDTIESIMRKPYFISDSSRVNSVFKRLRENQTHIAIVRNDKNICIGIVTMKDVLDEIFEDLFLEDEKREPIRRRLSLQ